jgi:YVTN family beta-propeller protein
MKVRSIAGLLVGLLVIGVALIRVQRMVRAASVVPGGPYSSQPLALSWDDSQLAVVNPDANTVSIFPVQTDQIAKAAEVAMGKEPSGVAFSSDGTRLYVANRVDGTVSVLSNYPSWNVTGTIPVGTEPFGMVLSASGKKLYVTNTMSNTVSVIGLNLARAKISAK